MIEDKIRQIKERITAACLRSKTAPFSITIVAVSKGRTAGEIKDAVGSGITDIGENRVQEALLKYNALAPATQYPCLAGRRAAPIKWHMIGHLQTNKVKQAVLIFDLIHSVDTLRLAKEIDEQAAKINKIQDILVEVKTSLEATKFGVQPEEVPGLIKEIMQLKNLNLKGLMTIAPIVNRAQDARPYFRKLRELRDETNIFLQSTQRPLLNTLSMGMTDDFEVAIEEGSNMLRLGRAIFEG